MALHGWVGAEDEILNAYASACLKASEDDEFFSKFKKVDADIIAYFAVLRIL